MTNRSVRFAVGSALGLLLTAGSGVAFAQDPPPAEGTTPPPAGETTPPPATAAPASGGDYNSRSITLRQGGLSVNGDLVANLSSGAAFKPFFITPNVYYGISDKLTLGIATNPFAETFTFLGGGLCLSGTSGNCSSVFDNISLDAFYALSNSGGLQLAIHGGLDFISFDPSTVALRPGVMIKFVSGALSVLADPAIRIGLTERDGLGRDGISIPVRVGYQVMPQLNLGLVTGLSGIARGAAPFDGFGDFYGIPLGLTGSYAVTDMLDVRAMFAFPAIVGADLFSGADFRVLSVGAAYRM